MGETPSGMIPPTGGSGGSGGVPETAAALNQAAGDVNKLPGDLRVKPAPVSSFGLDGESVRPASAGDVGATSHRKGPAAAGMGGGMGMPMGAPGQGQGGGKSKGSQQEDKALYTEDRAWTEAVIGNRRRQDSKEPK